MNEGFPPGHFVAPAERAHLQRAWVSWLHWRNVTRYNKLFPIMPSDSRVQPGYTAMTTEVSHNTLPISLWTSMPLADSAGTFTGYFSNVM